MLPNPDEREAEEEMMIEDVDPDALEALDHDAETFFAEKAAEESSQKSNGGGKADAVRGPSAAAAGAPSPARATDVESFAASPAASPERQKERQEDGAFDAPVPRRAPEDDLVMEDL